MLKMKTTMLEFDQVFDAADLERPPAFDAEAFAAAAKAVEAVRADGDAALARFAEEAGIAHPEPFEVSEAEIAAAEAEVDEDFLDALSYAIENLVDFHERQRRESWFAADEDGRLMGERVVPLKRVGVYIGNGGAFSPEILTSVVPALVAGVNQIVVCVEPEKDGSIDAHTIVAATTMGPCRIFKMGGPAAIAAMAYGTESIPKVDKIAGVGGADVEAAKKAVYGDVGLAGACGPVQSCVLFDSTAIPDFIAIDVLSQLELCRDNTVYLVAYAPGMLPEVQECLEEFVEKSPDPAEARAWLERVVAIDCCTMSQARDVVNKIAPARLELVTTAPIDSIGRLQNAGSVFMGVWTPASASACVAGLGCTTLAAGAPVYASALSVNDFTKEIPVLSYSFDALENDAWSIDLLAERAGAWAHGDAVALRLDFMDYVQEKLLQVAEEEQGAGACCCGHDHADGDCDCDDECECGSPARAGAGAGKRGAAKGKSKGAGTAGAKGKAGGKGASGSGGKGKGGFGSKGKGGAKGGRR